MTTTMPKPPARSVAGAAARISKGLPRHRHELPVIPVRAQGQLQDAGDIPIELLDIGGRSPQRGMALATGADHELADAARRVPGPAPGLRRPALVVVVMAGEDELRACRIQRLPQRLHARVGAVVAEAEVGVVPVGQRAGGGMGGEIVLEPGLLRRAHTTATGLGAVGVEDHDVPGAQGVAVVALRGLPGGGSEIAKVAARATGEVVMVARGRLGAALVAAPAGGITAAELAGRAGVVDIV